MKCKKTLPPVPRTLRSSKSSIETFFLLVSNIAKT